MNKTYTGLNTVGTLIRIIAIMLMMMLVILAKSKAAALMGLQHLTPISLVIKDARIAGDDLFVLGKNSRLYCLGIEKKGVVEHSEKKGMKGICKDQENMYAWNDHELYVYQHQQHEWRLLNRFDDRFIKDMIAGTDDTRIVFNEGLMSVKDQHMEPAPYPIRSVTAGDDIYSVCTNSFLYKFTKDNKFIKVAKIDSATWLKDMQIAGSSFFYVLNNNLKMIQTGASVKTGVAVGDAIQEILGYYHNRLFYRNGHGVFSFDPVSHESAAVLQHDVYNALLLDNGNMLYNDAEGQCIYFESETRQATTIGTGIKSYNIIDFLNGKDFDFIITAEGLVFKKGGNGQTFFDLSEASGKMFAAVKLGSDLYIACENGLLTFNIPTSVHSLNKDLVGIECNSVLVHEKYMYISSTEKGVYKIKVSKLTDADPRVTLINEGLLTASTYLLRNYSGVLYTVSNSGVYKKDTGKDYWIEYAGSGFIERITGIAHFKKHCEALLISSVEKGVMKTNDEGKTYTSMNLGLKDSAIIAMEADSTGFYALSKTGDIYFHPHEGIEWSKLNDVERFHSVFLHAGLLFLVNHENNIAQLATESFTPGMHVNWDIKAAYCHGDKINLSYKFTGHIGKTNHAVLQLTVEGQSFNKGNVLMYSDLAEGSMVYTIPDSVPPGNYKIRLVGTDPFIRSEKATTSFTIKKGTLRDFPLVIKDDKGTMLEARKADSTRYEWIFNGTTLNEQSTALVLPEAGSYSIRYTNTASGCSYTTPGNYFVAGKP